MLIWIAHFFTGCPLPIWVRTALCNDYEGVDWRCACGRRIVKKHRTIHVDD